MHLGVRRVVLIRLGACCFGATDILIGPRKFRIILGALLWLCGAEACGAFASYSFVLFGAFGTRCRVTESLLYLNRRFSRKGLHSWGGIVECLATPGAGERRPTFARSRRAASQ